MKTIAEMLKPRDSVFSDTAREDVLNLSDFAERRIDKEKFFQKTSRPKACPCFLIQRLSVSKVSPIPG